MKGLPKIRLSKKLAFVLGGAVVLSGTTGAAAVYIGADTLLGPSYEQLNGLECTEVNTVTIKKKDRFWVRKYITTEPTDGLTRVKTALRVAKAVHEAEHADLVQVVVLDKNAPTGRTELRGRAIGADVVFVANPARVPEEAQNGPYAARYVDKLANASGQFYGEKINLPLEDIEQLVARLDDKTDCIKPVVEAPEGHGADKGHGAEKAKGAEKGHGEAKGHDAAPADGHGAAPADGHGEAPKEGHGEETPVAEHGEGGESKGWMASIMGMVGLGSDEAPAAAEHDAATAAADGHGEATKPAAHDAASAAGHGEEKAAASADHASTAEAQPAAAEAESKGWFASVKSMVGLGSDEAPAADAHATPEPAAHDDAQAPAKGADHADNPVVSEADAHGSAATKEETQADAKEQPEEQAAAKPEEKAADGKTEASAAGADWLAKLRAKPLNADGAKQGGSAVQASDVPAEDSDVLPPKASDKAKPKTGDEHASAKH
ncbi:hypothetical protein [Rhizobium sp. RU36D]|uniref:hypothetical protein n=1 Tax=Rhizobium sp. RU36D TaxID=1907415 RepID=UPI0015C4AA5D|nr:hypothetical protein [Rhizobium sp. RU36D]